MNEEREEVYSAIDQVRSKLAAQAAEIERLRDKLTQEVEENTEMKMNWVNESTAQATLTSLRAELDEAKGVIKRSIKIVERIHECAAARPDLCDWADWFSDARAFLLRTEPGSVISIPKLGDPEPPLAEKYRGVFAEDIEKSQDRAAGAKNRGKEIRLPAIIGLNEIRNCGCDCNGCSGGSHCRIPAGGCY